MLRSEDSNFRQVERLTRDADTNPGSKPLSQPLPRIVNMKEYPTILMKTKGRQNSCWNIPRC